MVTPACKYSRTTYRTWSRIGPAAETGKVSGWISYVGHIVLTHDMQVAPVLFRRMHARTIVTRHFRLYDVMIVGHALVHECAVMLAKNGNLS